MGTAYMTFRNCPMVETKFTSSPLSLNELTPAEIEKGKQAVMEEVDRRGMSGCIDESTRVRVEDNRLWDDPPSHEGPLNPGVFSSAAETFQPTAVPSAPPREIPSVRVEDLPDAPAPKRTPSNNNAARSLANLTQGLGAVGRASTHAAARAQAQPKPSADPGIAFSVDINQLPDA